MLFRSHNDSLINAELSDQINRFATESKPQNILAKMDAIMSARENLQRNGAPLLIMEALMCELSK